MSEGAVDLGIAGLGPATPFARGGFATVYRAEQLSLHRPVAVKVVFAPPEDQASFRRFERECHTLGVVSNHPNIVVVHDGGVTDDGRPYLIMEYRAGGSLADVLADDGPLEPARVRDVGLKISEALMVAHEAGVIHRDVKPANILLSASGEPALADFGIARIDGGHRTTTGQISASVAHAAREVLSGGEPSAQSDVYSLGSTLLELGTGCTPYERHGDSTVWQLINRIMHEPPADAAAAGLPASLAAVVNRALDPDLTSRHATAAELRNELLAIDGDRLETMSVDPRATLAPTSARSAVGRTVRRAHHDRDGGWHVGTADRPPPIPVLTSSDGNRGGRSVGGGCRSARTNRVRGVRRFRSPGGAGVQSGTGGAARHGPLLCARRAQRAAGGHLPTPRR